MAAKIFRINYKSDFILTMNSEAGWTIPFCIKFWTSIPMRAYYVGFDGTTYTHCAYDPSEPTKLLVQFDDHHLPIGNLHFQISYHFTVDDFPNNTEDEVFNEAALTTEIDGETYQVMLDFNGETAPGIDFSLPSVGVTSVNGKVGVVTLTAEDVGAQPTIADLATIRSGAAAGATAVQPVTLQEGLATKQNVIDDLSTIRSGAAAGATAVQPATLQEGLAGKQDTISDLSTIRSGSAKGETAVQHNEINKFIKEGEVFGAGSDSAASFNPYADTVWNKQQTLSESQKQQIRDNIGVGAADNEDIQNVSGELKFADKAYNTSSHSGLGRKYLRKNIVDGKNVLTQAMVNSANTIYHIQYDYDLNGQALTIPEGCVLEFDGGSLRNGTIGSQTIDILSTKKCLYNVQFAGNCRYGYFHSKWFVNYSSSYDTTNDVTADLQQMFNCGAKNIIVDDGFYYITNTIVIEGDLDIYTEHDNVLTNEAGNIVLTPVIYGNSELVTLLNYKRVKTDGSKASLYIGAIKFYCKAVFDEVTEESSNIPIVKIETHDSTAPIWKADIYASVEAMPKYVTVDNKDVAVVNFTGIEIYADQAYISLVRLYGSSCFVYNAYKAHKRESTWFTDISINGYTRAVKGINTSVSPLSIRGTHQSIPAQTIYGENSYFSGETVLYESYVWDLAATPPTGYKFTERELLCQTLRTGSIKRSSYMKFNSPLKSNVKTNNFSVIDYNYKNYLSIGKTGDGASGMVPILSNVVFEYKNSNSQWIDGFNEGKTNVFNIDQLFTNDWNFAQQSGNITRENRRATKACRISDGIISKGTHLAFTVNMNYMTFNYQKLLMVCFQNQSGQASITIKASNVNSADTSEWPVLYSRTFEQNELFYPGDMCVYDIPENVVINNNSIDVVYVHVDIVIEESKWAPLCFIPFPQNIIDEESLLSKYRLPNIQRYSRIGFKYYDPSYKRYIVWNGTDWDELSGIKADTPISGSFNGKPTTASNRIKAGFNYLCTTSGYKKPIILYETINDSDKWIESDGATAGVSRSGTKAQRPNGSSIYVGFQYMQVDTTNGTFPLWASAISGDTVTWVKADGSDPDAA